MFYCGNSRKRSAKLSQLLRQTNLRRRRRLPTVKFETSNTTSNTNFENKDLCFNLLCEVLLVVTRVNRWRSDNTADVTLTLHPSESIPQVHLGSFEGTIFVRYNCCVLAAQTATIIVVMRHFCLPFRLYCRPGPPNDPKCLGGPDSDPGSASLWCRLIYMEATAGVRNWRFRPHSVITQDIYS